MGAHAVSLEVRVTNWRAQRLYARFGFRPVGIRRNYYAELHEDALIMWTDDVRTAAYRRAARRDRGDPPRGRAPRVITLGIETSCDETAVAVVEDGFNVRANLIAAPGPPARAVRRRRPRGRRAGARRGAEPAAGARRWSEAGVGFGDIDGVAVTVGPGLVGALLVGMAAAKAVALATGAPLIGVNHLEGHFWANFLVHGPPEPPYVALIVAGGHTMLVHIPEVHRHEVLGQTLDDAAGRRSTRSRGCSAWGSRAGRRSTRWRREGDPHAIAFPRAMADRATSTSR